MAFVEHSVAWARGELLDGVVMGAVGAALVVGGLLCWKLGDMQLTRALPVPLVLAGLVFLAGGVSAYVSNTARVEQFQADHRADPDAFVRAEKARVEGFASLYVGTQIAAPILFAIASILFWSTTAPLPRAVAIVLCLVGIGAFVIDGYSKERADIYYERITAEMGAGAPSEEPAP